MSDKAYAAQYFVMLLLVTALFIWVWTWDARDEHKASVSMIIIPAWLIVFHCFKDHKDRIKP